MSGSATTIPFDDGQLVYEGTPTAAQITAKSMTVIDNTPETLKGAALYTNATQLGILYQFTPPPFAADIAEFYNCLFFANTLTRHSLNITMLAVGGQYGVQSGDAITIGGNTFTAITTTPTANSNNFQIVTSGSPAQNINSTAINLCKTINQSSTNTTIYAYYVSSTSGLPGQIMLQNRAIGAPAFAVTYADAAGSTGGATAFSPALPSSGTTIQSSNAVNLNGLMYSQQQIPDAVPTVNILFAGSASKKILRIIPLRSSMFILKEDGVYRLTGSSPANFSIDLVDSTAILLAPESAVALNNQIFALTTQGVVAISDTGVQVMSRQIEDQLLALIELPSDVTLGSTTTNVTNAYSFGVSYESDRKYILWTPLEDGDTSAKQAFVYNYITRAWTRWTRIQQHGLVLSADDKLYVADPQTSYIDQERKSGTYLDYTDEAYSNYITAVSGATVTLSSLNNISVGDLLYNSSADVAKITALNPGASQVTVANSLSWPVVESFTSASVNTGASTVTITGHGYSTAQLVTLTTQGALPTGLTVGTSYYLIVVDANTLQFATSAANANVGTYITLTGAGTGTSQVIPTVFTLKAINCLIEWVPQSLANPGYQKQWSEATLLLSENYFNNASFNFYSDIDGSIESLPVVGQGSGGWGLFQWGGAPWGQVAIPAPNRSYVPRNKQRCDLLSVQFNCVEGWARFKVAGISLINRVISTRVGNS
jgi:hypothetical protein